MHRDSESIEQTALIPTEAGIEARVGRAAPLLTLGVEGPSFYRMKIVKRIRIVWVSFSSPVAPPSTPRAKFSPAGAASW